MTSSTSALVVIDNLYKHKIPCTAMMDSHLQFSTYFILALCAQLTGKIDLPLKKEMVTIDQCSTINTFRLA